MMGETIRCNVNRMPTGAFSDASQSLGWALEPCPWKPPVDIAETDSQYLITLEVPGIDLDSLNITYQSGLLDIKGEKRKESQVGECCHCSERYVGGFGRRFRITGGVEEEKINATYRDGILMVSIPKGEDREPRKIEVH